jgi:hypothetical protein
MTPTSPSKIDYRDLLRRYICHVGQAEDVTFIDFFNTHRSDVKFTQEEVEELERLEQESQ